MLSNLVARIGLPFEVLKKLISVDASPTCFPNFENKILLKIGG